MQPDISSLVSQWARGTMCGVTWDRITRFLFGGSHMSEAGPAHSPDQQQIEMIAAMGQRMVDVVNESIQIAGHSKNIETRRSRVRVARERIAQLQELAADYPFIKIERLTDVERDLAKIDSETDRLADATQSNPALQSSFLKLSLNRQCDALSIPIDVLHADRIEGHWMVTGKAFQRPEDAALAHYQAEGWVGTACEGPAMLLLMKAASLDYLASVNAFGSRDDACMRFFEAQCIIHRKRAAAIVAEIERVAEATLRANLAEIFAQPDYAAIYPAMDAEALIAIWHALGRAQLARFARHIFDDPGYRAGWPDLTLARGKAVMFVEVKTTDKLHASQRDVILGILQPSGADVRVLKLRPN